MKSHPYALFTNWTAATYIKEHRPSAVQSQATLTWLRAYGITAARVDAFLRLSHEHSATMPNGLVMDILELSNSKVRQTLKDEYLLDALLNTWSALGDVYGRTAVPADRELARLQLLVEAGHAVIMAQGMEYPGAETLLRTYWMETDLLDLSRIHKGTPGFKDVGKDLEYIKWLRKDLPKRLASVQAVQQPPCTKPTSVQGKSPNPSEDQRQGTSTSAQDEDRLPTLPTSGRRWRDPSANATYGLFGNWRDYWDNTLP
ncbi:hypothetical protein [Pseudarthrobacter sulfonivorans]|uniref:hypothetical protein n=1 Tax=Pseudarthrobacter sulfonivorans TaxID=121292 RepID=UPI002788DCE1|nr:hypothetical protein [Pseudarthrobacter sulfonivorans]MDP9998368.1 hypothetical protein [Pseudarthrobacter sulfonivorans]